MITENFQKGLIKSFFGGTKDIKITCLNGDTMYFSSTTTLGGGLLTTYTGSSTSDYGICLGRGTTPASASDYTLEDMISNKEYNIVFPNSYRLIENNEGKKILTTTYTIRNISENDLTVGEIGLIRVMGLKTTSTANSATNYSVLADRTVLEEPLIIPPGEIRALTYNLEFDLNFE